MVRPYYRKETIPNVDEDRNRDEAKIIPDELERCETKDTNPEVVLDKPEQPR
jgi:hypothetical protein